MSEGRKQTDWDEARREAEDPAQTPERLAELARRAGRWSSDAEWEAQTGVSRRVARHPNASPETLINLATGYPREVVGNPIFPLLFLERPDLTANFWESTLAQMLRSPDAPPPFLAACRSHPNRLVSDAARYHVALAGEADPDGPEWEREAEELAAALPLTYPDAVFELVELGLVPAAFAARVGFAAVHEPEPPDEYRLFAKRAEQAKRLRAKRANGTEAGPPATPEEGWAAAVAALPLPGLLKLALDPDLPDEAFAAIAERKTKKGVRLHLARNPSCPTEVLRSIIYYNTADRLGAHPNTTPDILKTIVRKYRHPDALEAVAANPQTPHDVLAALVDPEAYAAMDWEDVPVGGSADDGPDEAGEQPGGEGGAASQDGGDQTFRFRGGSARARRLARWHPAARDVSWDVSEAYREEVPGSVRWSEDMMRFLLGASQPLDREYFEMLAGEARGHLRLAAALNRDTPDDLRRRLAEDDSHRLVRAAAQARLRDPTRPLLGL